MKKITKRQFKNLFAGFSLLLIIDYPLLPFLLSLFYDNQENFCEEYSLGSCLLITLSFMGLIISFWCLAWLINYAIFFMDDYRNKKLKSNLSLPFYLYIKYTQKSFRNSRIKSSFAALILVILCFGAAYLFFHELSIFFFKKN